jgi:hypothetical protein
VGSDGGIEIVKKMKKRNRFIGGVTIGASERRSVKSRKPAASKAYNGESVASSEKHQIVMVLAK